MAKPQLSQELIVQTGLEILAKEGIDAVSMRRVAQALDTGPASLYAHVSNKDELDELMFDRILADIPLPKPDPARWRKQLKDLLHQQVQAMLAHPGIAKVAWRTMIPVGPNALRHAEAQLALLRAGGLSLKQAAYAADALSMYVKAFAYEGNAWSSGEVSERETTERGRQMLEYLRSLPPGTFDNLLEARGMFSGDNASERFVFALDAFLSGLTATRD
ncbi:TetR/AcrR family transcriptional regulator [Amycolatopsis taiwanensis]|uniref:TetR/AcrR family transcriptional regulator n=1 Tax=Amycolatopsis taiwanensis TaxID=342230 RepID=UPI0004B34A00|nr:TetR/AcrR family transcriptional regulator [Amycolatopsis taiwanensis]